MKLPKISCYRFQNKMENELIKNNLVDDKGLNNTWIKCPMQH